MTREDVTEAISHIRRKDPVLATVIDRVGLIELGVSSGNYFIDLVDSIVSQQLSIKAAATIMKRVVKLFPEGNITPEQMLTLPTETLREVGVSYGKIAYLKDLAEKTLASGILFEQFPIMTDEEIIEELIKVKGIGKWTAEMFLIFTLERPDVFSYGDLGLRNAIKTLYGLDHNPTPEEADSIARVWSPYKTVASRYLWKSLELPKKTS